VPLVRISLLKGKSKAHIRAIGEGVHQALIDAYNVPPDDLFQLICQHEPDELVYDADDRCIHSTDREPGLRRTVMRTVKLVHWQRAGAKMLKSVPLSRSRPRFYAVLWLTLAALVSIPSRPVGAETRNAPPDNVMIVGTKEAPPFAMKEADGTWTGISINLWRQIAEKLNLRYRFHEVPLQELIDGTAAGRLHASIGAITITADRERVVDFSQPYYTTSLGIAVRSGSSFNWLRLFGSVISISFLRALLGLIGMTLLIGALVWALERRQAEHFGGPAKVGLLASFWWSGLTLMQSVPEHSPKTLLGRMIAVGWMAASVISIAVFTGGVTSQMTTKQLEGDVHNLADLRSVHVGTASGTAALSYLSSQNIRASVYPDFSSGLKALKAGLLDAFVYDRPILYWMAKNKEYEESVKVLGISFDSQDYAIALPNDSLLRVAINRALLAIINTQEWRDSVSQYLGTEIENGPTPEASTQ